MKPIISIAVIAAAVTLSACGHKGDKSAAAPGPTIDVAIPTVDSVVLHREYPGTLSANSTVDLVARVNGYITFSNYDPGTTVSQGTVLFRIEDTQYRDAVAQARAQLETARATNVYNTNQYRAMKKALESDAVSQMDVIQAEAAMKESEASIRNAEAALQSALTTLSYCTVKAPFTGKISLSKVNNGSFVSGAASPVVLATIYKDDYFNAYFSIEDAAYMKMLSDTQAHQHVDYDNIPITFSDNLPHKYTGKLNYTAPDIDPSTGTMQLRARVDNPYGELKSGMYAKISLPYGVDPKAILVRDASIGTDQLGKYLYVVNDSNKVVYTPIEVGELVNDTLRIVTKGITPDTRYVTKALLKVRNGMKVNPRMAK